MSLKTNSVRYYGLLVLACLSIILGGFALSARWVRAAGNDLSISPEKPASADEWMLRSLTDGSDVSYSTFKGKVVFLNFWATWCGPCLQEMPTIERMYQKLKIRASKS